MGDDFLNDDNDLDLFDGGMVDSLDAMREEGDEDEDDEDFGFTLGDEDGVEEDF